MFIEINLLPEELRPKRKGAISLSPQDIIDYIVMAAAILIAINIILFILTFTTNLNVTLLDKKLLHFKPHIQKIQDLESQLKQLQEKVGLVRDLTSKRILWSEKLEIISDLLPYGIWLRSMAIKQSQFNIEASCVSLKSEEMNIISKFINELKNNSRFFSDFNKLELTSVNRRMVASIEIVDFSLVGSIKR